MDVPVYTLTAAAELVATTPSALLQYERLGLMPPRLTAADRARYSERDLLKLRAIHTLVRDHGANPAAVRHIVKLLQTVREQGLQPPAELMDVDVTAFEA